MNIGNIGLRIKPKNRWTLSNEEERTVVKRPVSRDNKKYVTIKRAEDCESPISFFLLWVLSGRTLILHTNKSNFVQYTIISGILDYTKYIFPFLNAHSFKAAHERVSLT